MTGGVFLSQKEYKRPDEVKMEQIIQNNRGTAAEIALRLAWNLGLTRDEMHNLKWSDVSFAERAIYLPDRKVPMDDESVLSLESTKTERGHASAFVMTSDRNYTRMAPQYISRVVRIAMQEGGLAGFTMIDLRHDYIIRMLEKHGWPYAARVSGTAVATLYTNYSEYMVNKGDPPEKEQQGDDVDFKLWKIIETEGTSPEGLTLWMAWKLGMRIQEIATLTWSQVDLKKGTITLPDRSVKVGGEFLKKLKAVKAERSTDADPHVILTPRAQKPFDMARLSRVLRTAMIRGGVDMTLQDLLNEEKRKAVDEQMVEIVAKYGSATRNEIIKELPMSTTQFYARAERLVERGSLVRIGQKLYLPGTVVPPEEHYEVIRAYLETVGAAFRGDLANLLHVDGNQCAVVLRALVEEGKLQRSGQVYTLPDEVTNM